MAANSSSSKGFQWQRTAAAVEGSRAANSGSSLRSSRAAVTKQQQPAPTVDGNHFIGSSSVSTGRGFTTTWNYVRQCDSCMAQKGPTQHPHASRGPHGALSSSVAASPAPTGLCFECLGDWGQLTRQGAGGSSALPCVCDSSSSLNFV